MHVPKKSPEVYEEKTDKIEGKIDSSTIIVGGFNTFSNRQNYQIKYK